MDLGMTANFTVVGINTVLLSGLLAVYGRMLWQASTRFTTGLALFAGALWLQNVVQLYCFITMRTLYAGDIEWVVLVQNVTAMLASAVLLAVTLDPIGRGAAKTA